MPAVTVPYWSARRISPADVTGRPSSVNAAAPRVGELAHLGELLARRASCVIAAMKPTGTTASRRACSTSPRRTGAESTTGSVFGIATIAQ